MENKYIGHSNQFYGVEVHRLMGGKGDGMRLLEVNNGKGLQLTISLDRCGDISRLIYKGINCGYMSPVGYVHPKYYKKDEFLSSFTAGFLTTCGLNNVGAPNIDNNENLPLHGTISNTPVDSYTVKETKKEIIISLKIIDEELFSHKLVLVRNYHISLKTNSFYIEDEIINKGSEEYPVEILYHFNVGYPLLSETSELNINSSNVRARNDFALKDIENWKKIAEPTKGMDEKCYFHDFEKDEGSAAIFNKKAGCGLKISFDTNNLKYFTEWKMMGERDYVLGLEPGNAHPDGRNKMRQENALTILKPNESIKYNVNIKMFSQYKTWKKSF